MVANVCITSDIYVSHCGTNRCLCSGKDTSEVAIKDCWVETVILWGQKKTDNERQNRGHRLAKSRRTGRSTDMSPGYRDGVRTIVQALTEGIGGRAVTRLW